MSQCFAGVEPEKIDKFFVNMIVSDSNSPHTHTKLSPITFCEFLSRNQIMTLDPFPAYEAANKVWQRFLKFNQDVLKQGKRGQFNLDMAEESQGGWNLLIDYMRRIEQAKTMANAQYYQMHYFAHVVHNFYRESEKVLDADTCSAYRTLFNEVIGPILYDPLIPTNYAFLPIINFSDIRFATCAITVIEKATKFIECHTGRLLNHKAFDAARCVQIRDAMDAAMTGIYKNKYEDPEKWQAHVKMFLERCSIYKADMEACELSAQFQLNGMQCALLLEKIEKYRHRFNKGLIDDPDDALDLILEMRPQHIDDPAEDKGAVEGVPEKASSFQHGKGPDDDNSSKDKVRA